MPEASNYRVVVSSLKDPTPILLSVNGTPSYVVLVGKEGYSYWNKASKRSPALPNASVEIEADTVLTLSHEAPVWFVYGGHVEKQAAVHP
ncbi:hypothetical protein [Microcystis phage Mvi-JY20]|uniref:Uncharacterized protein n=1 Tax=Microcystis phage Mvi-JY20 TaxID=3128146 RepID=A0AAX4QH47_9CAUD